MGRRAASATASEPTSYIALSHPFHPLASLRRGFFMRVGSDFRHTNQKRGSAFSRWLAAQRRSPFSRVSFLVLGSGAGRQALSRVNLAPLRRGFSCKRQVADGERPSCLRRESPVCCHPGSGPTGAVTQPLRRLSARLPLSRSAQLNGDALRDGSHHRLSIRLSNDLLICSIVEFCSLGAAQANAPSWLRPYDAKPLRCALAYSQLPHCGHHFGCGDLGVQHFRTSENQQWDKDAR